MSNQIQIPKVRNKAKAKAKPKVKRPKLFHAIFLNDDHTTMQFVVQVLIDIFGKSAEEAERVMMTSHLEGRGVAGTYTCEICEQKVGEAMERAKDAGFPLLVVMEEQ